MLYAFYSFVNLLKFRVKSNSLIPFFLKIAKNIEMYKTFSNHNCNGFNVIYHTTYFDNYLRYPIFRVKIKTPKENEENSSQISAAETTKNRIPKE